jgi:tetratricopeptide (TPR) repeat protein
VIWFGIAIAYGLNLYIPVSGIIMDRYNFIPSAAFCLAAAFFILHFTDSLPAGKWRMPVLTVVLMIFAWFTFSRTGDWKNSFTLFDADLPHLQNSVHANRIAAGTYIHLALEEEMKPNYNKVLTDSFINKGERYALRALKVYDKDARVWEHLGLCAMYRKDNSNALNLFRKSYETDTTYLSGINYLGATFWNLNQVDSAIYYFNYVIQHEPAFGYSANNLVNLYIKNGRKPEADSLLKVLQQRFPQDINLQNKIREVNSR